MDGYVAVCIEELRESTMHFIANVGLHLRET